MEQTFVKKWGIQVSRLGFGCMRLPLNAEGKIDGDRAGAMVDRAIEAGVNYFDTAFGYHGGESEIFIGQALKRYPRESFYLATKLPLPRITTEASITETFEEQLRKTQMEYFDFYMLHGVNGARIPDIKRLKIHERLMAYKAEGRIRHIGFSFHGDYEALCEMVDNYEWDFVQIQYNYVDDVMTGAGALYEKLCEKGIPIVVMEPVRGGYLANPPEAVKEIMAGFEGGKVSPAGWALRWMMGQKNTPVILSGMSSMEQLNENLETFSQAVTLSKAQREMVDRCRDLIIGQKSIPCTACRYCMDCPAGVDIPGVFAVYNEYQLFKNAFRARNNYGMLKGKDAGADRCVSCGVCVPLCPQGIDIPGMMKEVLETLENV